MAKKVLPKAPVVTKSRVVTNRQLQAAIESINKLIVERSLFGTQNAFALARIAVSIESAYKPAAAVIDRFRKETQESIQKVAEEFKKNNPEIGEEDEINLNNYPKIQKQANKLSSEFNARVEELLDLEVEIEYIPLNLDVFKDKDGEDVNMDLGTPISFMPFMKE